MSAHIEIKPGRSYRTLVGHVVYVVQVDGWVVTYRYSDSPESYRTSFVDFSKAIAEDVTP